MTFCSKTIRRLANAKGFMLENSLVALKITPEEHRGSNFKLAPKQFLRVLGARFANLKSEKKKKIKRCERETSTTTMICICKTKRPKQKTINTTWARQKLWTWRRPPDQTVRTGFRKKASTWFREYINNFFCGGGGDDEVRNGGVKSQFEKLLPRTRRANDALER